MKKLFVLLVACMCFVASVYAGETDQSETAQLKEEIKKEIMEEIKKSGEGLPEWTKRIHLSGTLEGDLSWTEHSDVANRESDSASDLFISTVELGVEADFTDWIRGFVLFLAEDLGTGDETDVTVDETTLTLQKGNFPFYLTFGKRVQPFGIFENHLLTDPMTQDAYETNRAGVTVGYTGRVDSDISLTVYKGEEQMNHLFEAGLFDTDTVSRADGESNDVGSFIISALLTPIENHLTLFAAYLSEPGRGRRNNSVNAGISLVPPFIEKLRIDGEYMKALDRERYDGLDREFKEGVLSVSVAYEVVLREREVIGGGLFAERKAHIVSEPFEIAVRYEHFNDDGMTDKAQAYSVKNRYSLGGRYTFYNDGLLTAYLGAEYRRSDYRVPESMKGTMADDNDEFLARLGLTF